MAERRPLDDHEVIIFDTLPELHRWFRQHGAMLCEQWIGYWKKDSGRTGVTYAQVLDEALCFGWIDGVKRRVDDECYANRWTPRKPTSVWSEINRRRIGELIEAGRVQRGGRAVWEARDAVRSRRRMEARRDAALTPAHERALRANRAAWAWWTKAPPGYRRLCAGWVTSAKRSATQEARLSTLIDCCARGVKVPPLAGRGAR